ncbi:MAG: glycoside hydrolase family 9 protein, partial [Actinobacteria bacterium]|nr:glycoside hydrolase family 9 protein [Actinomycetota bacterium]
MTERSTRGPAVVILAALVFASVSLIPHASGADLREGEMSPPEPLVASANVLTADWIELELPEMEYDIDNVANTALYTVTCADDPDYAAGAQPLEVHHRYWPENAWYNPGLSPEDDDGGKGNDVAHINIVYRIFLRVPTPLDEGSHYTVTVDPSVVTVGPLQAEFGPAAPTPVIHASQVSYLADGPKVAYLSFWTGQGCIDFSGAATFSIIDDSSAQSVFDGTTVLEVPAAEDTWSHSDVYSVDFSDLTAEGTYHVQVPGVGVSYPFEISEEAFKDVGYTVLRGLALQRDGDHGLDDPAVTHWNRSPAHLDDAIDQATIPGAPKDYYEPSELAAGTRVDLVGGHMDAGDRGKYPHNSADACASMLSTISLFPGQVEGLGESLQIPESGNHVPDLIDEVVWELDWLRKAVANTYVDGGLPFTLRPNGFGYEGYTPDTGATDRVFYDASHGPNRSETLLAAGSLAMACNTPLLVKYLPPSKLEGYRQAALRAFDCFEAHKDDASFWASEDDAGWYDSYMPDQTFDDLWTDEMMFAAANLHRLTGEAGYLEWVESVRPAEYRDWRVWYWSHYGPPLYGYLSLYLDQGASQELRDWARDGILNGAETTLVYDWQTYDRTYGAPLPWHAETMVGWYFTANEMGFPQMLGYGVSGDETYLDQLALNWNYLLGTNPLSRTFISGLGRPDRRPRWFVHELSQRKWAEYNNGMGGWSEPPPGLPAADIQDGYHNWWLDDAWNAPRHDKRFPAIEEYPPLYRYHDSWTVTDEMTIERMSRNACTVVPLVPTALDEQPGVTVTSPDGGEKLEPGGQCEVTWSCEGLVGNVRLEYSTDGFETSGSIATLTENDGAFTWIVPDEPSTRCLVRVGGIQGGPTDVSDGFFEIVGEPEEPRPASTFYFAEGTCRPGFEPYICVQNPGAADAAVKVTYMLG